MAIHTIETTYNDAIDRMTGMCYSIACHEDTNYADAPLISEIVRNTTVLTESHTMAHNTQPTPEEQMAHDINRLREIRHATRKLGYILNLPRDYNNQDIDQAANELSTLVKAHNEEVGIRIMHKSYLS